MSCALQALRAKGMDEMLNTQSWRNLETLLSKAGMYTQFLTEQLSKFDENLAGSAEQVRVLQPFEAWHVHFRLMVCHIQRWLTFAEETSH